MINSTVISAIMRLFGGFEIKAGNKLTVNLEPFLPIMQMPTNFLKVRLLAITPKPIKSTILVSP